MATYVVGDIHGCFREWISFKSKIERQDAEAEFILVGDIVDKGPHSMEMLKWAMEKIAPGSKYQMVLGNHEAEKLEWLKYVLKHPENEVWKDQSIARKMLSQDGYEFYKVCCEKKLQRDYLIEIYNWLKSIPEVVYKEIVTANSISRYIITHHPMDLEKQAATIIHGHLPTTLEPCKSVCSTPGKIWIREQMINVDCGLVYGVSKKQGLYGDLAAIRLEDFQEFYYYNHGKCPQIQ